MNDLCSFCGVRGHSEKHCMERYWQDYHDMDMECREGRMDEWSVYDSYPLINRHSGSILGQETGKGEDDRLPAQKINNSTRPDIHSVQHYPHDLAGMHWHKNKVTASGEVVENKKRQNSEFTVSCCNCAKEGHFVTECMEDRMDEAALYEMYPLIISYDGLIPTEQWEGWSHFSEKIDSNSTRQNDIHTEQHYPLHLCSFCGVRGHSEKHCVERYWQDYHDMDLECREGRMDEWSVYDSYPLINRYSGSILRQELERQKGEGAKKIHSTSTPYRTFAVAK